MQPNYKNIQVIAFDADDTLWVNETYFRAAEQEFATLLSGYETQNKIDQELFKKELENLPLYGYGVKGFVLSMVEMAIELSNYSISNTSIQSILNIGKEMLNKPVELLDGVPPTLKALSAKYKLIVVTKGDLLDQERKLEKSGLLSFFHHIEVLSDKKKENYQQVLNHLELDPQKFLMVGNSLKSDVLPVLEVQANAIHIPFHTTWEHEKVAKKETEGKTYKTITKITELLNLL